MSRAWSRDARRSSVCPKSTSFEIFSKSMRPDRSPIRSSRRQLRMMGSGKLIPDRDAVDIGLPSRRFLSSDDRYVLVIDALERVRSTDIQPVFDRYRLALDHQFDEQRPFESSDTGSAATQGGSLAAFGSLVAGFAHPGGNVPRPVQHAPDIGFRTPPRHRRRGTEISRRSDTAGPECPAHARSGASRSPVARQSGGGCLPARR